MALLVVTVIFGPTKTFANVAVAGVGSALSVTETVYVPGGKFANTPVVLIGILTGPVRA